MWSDSNKIRLLSLFYFSFFFERAEDIYLRECIFFQEFVESLFLRCSNPQNTFDSQTGDWWSAYLWNTWLCMTWFIVTSFCTYLFLSPLISHSIYFLALSLNTFWLSAKIKSILKVQRFDFSEEILKSVHPCLKSILCILWAITMYRFYLSPWAAL